jgi:hypothetical protein
MNERMGARPWLAHTQHDYARLLIARGTADDRAKGDALLATAVDTYRELGMAGPLARAERGRAHGVRRWCGNVPEPDLARSHQVIVDPRLGGRRLDVESQSDFVGEQRARPCVELALAQRKLPLASAAR